MTKLLELFGIIGGIIPIVLILIKEFETPGFGTEKKQAVLNSVALIYDQFTITAISKEKLLGLVGSFIDIVVAFFNVIGWFKKSNPTPNI